MALPGSGNEVRNRSHAAENSRNRFCMNDRGELPHSYVRLGLIEGAIPGDRYVNRGGKNTALGDKANGVGRKGTIC
jgi:hypothetical protein